MNPRVKDSLPITRHSALATAARRVVCATRGESKVTFQTTLSPHSYVWNQARSSCVRPAQCVYRNREPGIAHNVRKRYGESSSHISPHSSPNAPACYENEERVECGPLGECDESCYTIVYGMPTSCRFDACVTRCQCIEGYVRGSRRISAFRPVGLAPTGAYQK